MEQVMQRSWGFMCPVHTPDGSPCGLLNHLTAACQISSDLDARGVRKHPLQNGQEYNIESENSQEVRTTIPIWTLPNTNGLTLDNSHFGSSGIVPPFALEVDIKWREKRNELSKSRLGTPSGLQSIPPRRRQSPSPPGHRRHAREADY